MKLLDAIAALRNEASGKTPSVDATTTSSAPSAYPEDRAERRQVTVMFSDLWAPRPYRPAWTRKTSVRLSRLIRSALPRLCDVLAASSRNRWATACSSISYPQAHEDDAERSVHAGLELVAAVSGLKTHAALQTRVGIATGLVVVGDLIGSGASQEQAIVGETPNLAARLQGIAEPNSVVIAESTRKLVGNLFELEDLGTTDLLGSAGPGRGARGGTSTTERATLTTAAPYFFSPDDESDLPLKVGTARCAWSSHAPLGRWRGLRKNGRERAAAFSGGVASKNDHSRVVATNGPGRAVSESTARRDLVSVPLHENGCWIDVATGRLLDIRPTHWREQRSE